MIRLHISFAVTILSVLSLHAYFESTRADDLADCERAGGDKQIQGCSRIIASETLFGQPISKQNLSAAYNNRARAYSKKGALDEAIADYTMAISLRPDYAPVYYNRGIAYGDKNEADLAIADFDMAIKLNPDYAAAYNNRGIAYQFKGELDRAIADYDSAIKLNSQYATAYNNRGDAFEKKGDTQRAIADYRKALSLDPSHKAARYNLKKLDAGP